MLLLVLISSVKKTEAQYRNFKAMGHRRGNVGFGRSVSSEERVTKSVIVSKSEDITPRNGMITTNPLKFFLFSNLPYYHRLSSNSALGFGVQVPTLSGIDGIGVNAEFRAYPSQKSLRGFYVAPNVSFTSIKAWNTKA